MGKISEFTAGFLLNAAWQIPLIALVAWACSRLLRSTATRYRHTLWVVSLVLTLALPLWSLFDFTLAGTQRNAEQVINALPHETIRPVTPGGQPARETASADAGGPSLAQLLQKHRQPLLTAPILSLALFLCYGLFVLYRLGRLWRSWRQAKNLRRSAYERVVPEQMSAIASRCRAALGIGEVPLVCSSVATAPVTVGATRPLIILPESFYATLADETLVSVLGHEMAHVRRRDYALNLAYEFLYLPVSLHPLAGFIRRQVDRTRELACDEIVTERLLEPKAYARALVNVASALLSSPDRQAFTLGIFDADILEERIMKLTQKTGRKAKRAGRVLIATAFTLLCLSCLAISTFSFELRADTGFAAGGVHRAAVEDVLNESGYRVSSQVETPAPNRGEPTQTTTGGGEQASDSTGAQERAEEACEAERRRAVGAIPSLIQMLGDDRPTRLLRCWDRSSWSPALETFRQPSPGEQAAIALASMGTPAVEPLKNALSDSSASVRRNAAWAIGELTNMRETERAGTVPSLISLLSDSDEWVRMAAARALGEIRDERAVENLINVLSDSSGKVRELGAWALGEMKEERAVQPLCKLLLEDARVEVRETAAWALGEIKDPQAARFLKQALNDAEAGVREKAVDALSEIEDSDG
jgi:HEAT repeat protein/beta-lactamase regulating signal transducer with metallopeptidase domain